MIPHLPGWLQFGVITIVVGPLVFAVPAHAAGGALATVGVGVRLNGTAPRAIAAAVLILVGIPILNSAAPPKATQPSHPHATASAAVGQVGVVEAFMMAISDHNWPRVWQLEGKNLGTGKSRTYPGMISGYRCTDRDVLDSKPTASGEVVSGSFLAYEAKGTAHAVQRYMFRYVVRGGVIVSGHVSLVSGSPPPGC